MKQRVVTLYAHQNQELHSRLCFGFLVILVEHKGDG